MQIELVNGLIQAKWPRYPKPTHDEIVRRLKTISGTEFDKQGKCWWVPAGQADRVMALFPRASFDYDTICAATDAESGRERAFYDSMVYLGVEFAFDESGAIVAVGDGVSPLIQSLVDERADALRPLVLASMANPKPKPQPAGPMHGPYSAEDAKFEPLLKGIQNARKAEQEREVRYPKRRRKAKVQQGELGL